MTGAIEAEVEAIALSAAPATVSGRERWSLLIYGGLLLTLVQFSVPYEGLVGLPITFFLKNKLHLDASALAQFNLIAGIPLMVGVLFGFLRDTWSPGGRGDRGHLMAFGLAGVAIYAVMAVLPPSYFVLLGGVLLGTCGVQMLWSAARGLVSAAGQQQAITGQMSTVVNIASSIPSLVSYLLGGFLSAYLEGQNAVSAARILFLVGATLMGVIALFGLFGPARLFKSADTGPRTATMAADALRLLRHAPIYPVLIIQLIWQFAPATGAVLPYHMGNDLHASDSQVGAWYAIFFGSFAPVYLLYGWLCQKFRLKTLLWVGTLLAVLQMAPLLVMKTPQAALIAAAVMGVMGGVAQSAYTDLAIRSCPKGLQGAMMMLFMAMYWVTVRFGDLLGAWLYGRAGGFNSTVLVSLGIYALLIPAMLLIPRHLTQARDGEVAGA